MIHIILFTFVKKRSETRQKEKLIIQCKTTLMASAYLREKPYAESWFKDSDTLVQIPKQTHFTEINIQK